MKPLCKVCNKVPAQYKGVRRKDGLKVYKRECYGCQSVMQGKPRYRSVPRAQRKYIERKYRRGMKPFCERCDFVPEHKCQLDVDHVDGNHENNDPSNLMTLCANCHRIKTYRARDWDKKKDLKSQPTS